MGRSFAVSFRLLGAPGASGTVSLNMPFLFPCLEKAWITYEALKAKLQISKSPILIVLSRLTYFDVYMLQVSVAPLPLLHHGNGFPPPPLWVGVGSL